MLRYNKFVDPRVKKDMRRNYICYLSLSYYYRVNEDCLLARSRVYIVKFRKIAFESRSR